MAIANYDILQLAGFEQGTITASGSSTTDADSSTRIRSIGYIELNKLSTSFTLTIDLSVSKNIRIGLVLYSDSNSSSFVHTFSWYNNSSKIDISSYRNTAKYFRLLLQYSDNSNISPTEITMANAVVEYAPPWYVENNMLTHIDLPNRPTENFIQEPYPPFWWYVDEDNSRLTHTNLPQRLSGTFIQEPYLPFWWYVDNNKLKENILPDPIYQGAFCNCTNLIKVIIPPSVKYIGEYAFYNTSLTTVTIARDCTFFPTSFPPRCIINYYND